MGNRTELVSIEAHRLPKPEWLKAPAPLLSTLHSLKELARQFGLHTVCESAQCPNIGECWKHRTATFMLLGNICTRRCGFCAVPKGRPVPIDYDEPRRVAEAIAQLGLRYAVVTSVDRDDDNVGAAKIFANTIIEIRRRRPVCKVEVLIPDFQGREDCLRIVLNAGPDILNHNTETVPRLYRKARSGAYYDRTVKLLEKVKTFAPVTVSKSGLMVGLGETKEELYEVFRDLAAVKVNILTLGQYLRPSHKQLPVVRFYSPQEFEELKQDALALGFSHVESAPLVRSSYHAHQQAESSGL